MTLFIEDYEAMKSCRDTLDRELQDNTPGVVPDTVRMFEAVRDMLDTILDTAGRT